MSRQRLPFRHRHPLRLIERRMRLRGYAKGIAIVLACSGILVPLFID